MSTDADKGGVGGRLWAGSGRDKAQAHEKVLPLKPPPAPAPQDRTYLAFELRDRAERLHIVRAAGPSRFPNYNYLLDISYDHHLQSAFTLIYTFMIVEVTGWNLWPIVHAVSFGNCECIREFHPKLYDVPENGEPLIEKIQITAVDEKS
jgi:hypothetical protein